LLGLGQTSPVEGRVSLPLVASFDVPVGFSMPDKYQTGQ